METATSSSRGHIVRKGLMQQLQQVQRQGPQPTCSLVRCASFGKQTAGTTLAACWRVLQSL